MSLLFYVSGVVTVISAALVITRTNVMHALVYLILLFVSTAAVFYSMGASLIAVLQIIIYAGAIMILFVFIVMLLNLGPATIQRERTWLTRRVAAPAVMLAVVLFVLLLAVLGGRYSAPVGVPIGPKTVAISLFRVYFIGVEAASVLLLAALVGAFHFGYLRGRAEQDAD